MKVLISIIFILFSFISVAQTGQLTLHGVVENESSSIGFADIEVYKDNELYYSDKAQRNGSYKLDLELGSIYSIAFSKGGYIEKSVAVIAKSDTSIDGRYFFQLDIELFRLNQDTTDESVMPPVAKLYLKNEAMGFRYDKKYVVWAAEKYEELEK